MALKPVTCSGDASSLKQRVLTLTKKLKPGQCYVVTDVADEFGVAKESIMQAAKKMKCYALRSGVRGVLMRGVLVNPAHVGVKL